MNEINNTALHKFKYKTWQLIRGIFKQRKNVMLLSTVRHRIQGFTHGIDWSKIRPLSFPQQNLEIGSKGIESRIHHNSHSARLAQH